MDTVFRSSTVERDAVIAAMRRFDREYPEPNDYAGWLEKDTYKYAVELRGRLYPPKHLLSRVTGVPTSDFSGGEETNRVFEELGFTVQSVRNPAWVRDEVILALDLYRRHGQERLGKEHADVVELSDLLRRLPLHPMRRYRSSFRNPTGVAMKLGNFLSLDPDYEGVGLSSTSQLDKEVWAEFEGDEERLRTTAEAIRRNYHRLDPDLDLAEVEEDDEAPEGRILMRLHKKRERSRSLVHKKKQQVHDATGQLACEICGFDFEATYGVLGKGFAECHHTTPVATLEPGHRTHVSDLAIVCANCHRMLHRESGGLGLEDLRTRLVARS